MNPRRLALLLPVLACAALLPAPAFASPWMGYLTLSDPTVWPEGRSGNYGTSKYFLDETQGDVVPLTVQVEVYADSHPPQDLEVQLYTNLDRRDFAKIFEAPGDAGGPTSYYRTVPMTYAGSHSVRYVYRAEVDLTKTGVYRVTARFRIQGGPWLWHNDFTYDGMAQRDAVVVASPAKVRALRIYEVNPFVVEATPGGTAAERSTFEDFLPGDADGFDPFDLPYVRYELGFNALWVMPIFPNTAWRWNPTTWDWTANYAPGSPYAARDYWSVSERLSDGGTSESALAAFNELLAEAELYDLDVFIDIAMNHAGRDVIHGQGAVDLGLCAPSQKDAWIRTDRPTFLTRGSNWPVCEFHYREHATSDYEAALYAPADRGGTPPYQWWDANSDFFFGSYSDLGLPSWHACHGLDPYGDAEDERDLFYTDLDPAGGLDTEVENVWRYFSYLLPYWLEQTDGRLAGIRADFSQGLPSRLWEYLINKTRQVRWDFVFLAEALEPAPVRYRMNRVFDVMTTVDHTLYRSSELTMTQIQASLETEASLYGYNAALMHNGTSHDEDGNPNQWLMVARYAVAAAVGGVPMVYMGQPLGAPYRINFETAWVDMTALWDNDDPAVNAMYGRINSVRAGYPALSGTGRYFLQKRAGGGVNDDIFAVARFAPYEHRLLVFVNLRDHAVGSETYAFPAEIPTYPEYLFQATNLVADDPALPLWPMARLPSELAASGVPVTLNLPNEVQYLWLKVIGSLCDADDNGILSAGDALEAFTLAIGVGEHTQEQAWRCDANRDAQVSAGDAQDIFMAALGLPSACDVAGRRARAGGAEPGLPLDRAGRHP